jgi:hypothetical protein
MSATDVLVQRARAYDAVFNTGPGREVLADLIRFASGPVGDAAVRCGRNDMLVYIQKQLLPAAHEAPTVLTNEVKRG